MGKTAFALNVLNNVALKQLKTVVFISLEMSSESIVDRILSEVAGVPMYKLNGSEQMNEEDFSKI
jgi:replicative DNA helicase